MWRDAEPQATVGDGWAPRGAEYRRPRGEEYDLSRDACPESRYVEWLQLLIYWDGMLPLAMLAVPRAANLFFDGAAIVQVLAGVFIPIGAFFIRARHGADRLNDGRHRSWQVPVFMLALLVLLLFDAMLILFTMIPQGIRPADWRIVWLMYGVYVALAAIALFPYAREE